jgi:hypothetical protein
MKSLTTFTTFATLASTILTAYVPSDPWTGLTPDSPVPSGASTDYSKSFGIQIVLMATAASAEAENEISKDKKVKAGNHKEVAQITDGQAQVNSHLLATPTPLQQIGDGQVQHQTNAPAQQIGDGQVQHQTNAPVQQIGDGQVQHQTNAPVQQIGDGQVQHQTVSVANQISDGQVQKPTGTAANEITDGQVQQTGSPASPSNGGISAPQACYANTTLAMTIAKSILTDAKGRIGAIVANRQFQFDGPPPQAGTIYAAGWSVTSDGYLALGNSTTFYQCLSGDFYNLYDEKIGGQCHPVNLSIVHLVKC